MSDERERATHVRVLFRWKDCTREEWVSLEDFAKLFTPTIERFKDSEESWRSRAVLRPTSALPK